MKNNSKDLSILDKNNKPDVFDPESRQFFDKIIQYLSTLVKRRSKIKTKHKSHRRKIGKGRNPKTNTWEDLYGDYLKVNYFKELINKEFPDLWDWMPANKPVFAANRLIITDGVLKVFIKERFMLFLKLGVSPDVAIKYSWKSYYSVGADYYQFNEKGNPISKSGPPKTSNTEAWKKAVNMGTSLGDDTYAYDEDLVMSIDKIEEYIKQIQELKLQENETGIFCEKLLGFQEYQMECFFETIKSNIPLERKITALDVLVELLPSSLNNYKNKLNQIKQEYTNQTKGE